MKEQGGYARERRSRLELGGRAARIESPAANEYGGWRTRTTRSASTLNALHPEKTLGVDGKIRASELIDLVDEKTGLEYLKRPPAAGGLETESANCSSCTEGV